MLSLIASAPPTKLTSSTKRSGSIMQPSLASGPHKNNLAAGTSGLNRAKIEKKQSARATHMYSRAYEAILNSESQLPVFLHHPLPSSVNGGKKKHVSTPGSMRVEGAEELVAEAVSKDRKKVDDCKKQGLLDLLDPHQQLQQEQQESPQLQPTQSQERTPKKVSSFNDQAIAGTMRGRFEGGISAVKILFDRAFGPEAPQTESYMNSISDAIQQADELYNDATVATKPDVVAVSKPTLDDIARQNEKALAAIASAFGSSQDKESVMRKRMIHGVVIVNNHEYRVEDEHTNGFDQALDRGQATDDDGHFHQQQQHHAIMDSLNESDDIRTPFLHRNPSSSFSGFSEVPAIDWLQSKSIFCRTTALFALVMSGFLVLLLVVSYMMYARRKNTSPLAFFQYLIAGIFTSPLKNSSAMSDSTVFSFAKSPSTHLGRRSSWPRETEPSTESRWTFGFGNGIKSKSGPLLPEPVVASSTSSTKSKALPALMEMRRTSASQYHLQQVLATQRHVDL